jgi:hypothetical protein
MFNKRVKSLSKLLISGRIYYINLDHFVFKTTESSVYGWSSTTDSDGNCLSADGWSTTSQDENGWSATDVEDNRTVFLPVSDSEHVTVSESNSLDHERVLAKPLAARSMRDFIACE